VTHSCAGKRWPINARCEHSGGIPDIPIAHKNATEVTLFINNYLFYPIFWAFLIQIPGDFDRQFLVNSYLVIFLYKDLNFLAV
jgi:hypothetical protein